MELEDAQPLLEYTSTDKEDLAQVQAMIQESLADFSEKDDSPEGQAAAKLARAAIKDETRSGHVR